MAVPIDATIMMSEDHEAHLAAAEVVAFVDRTADADAMRRITLHLASCGACRAEVAEVSEIVGKAGRRQYRPAWLAGVAAAALVAVIAWPRGAPEPPLVHREAPVTTAIAPAARYPVGVVDSAPAVVWSVVPYADRYRVRLFTADGSVIWERETTDTALALPAAPRLRAGENYYWNVEAQIGFDRTVTSELTAFSVRFPR
jgi:hypothetical protein